MSFADRLVSKIKNSRFGIAELLLAVILVVEGFTVAYVDNLQEVHVVPLWLRLVGHLAISVFQIAFGMAFPEQLYQAVMSTPKVKTSPIKFIKEWVEFLIVFGITIYIPLLLMGIVAEGLGEYDNYKRLGFLGILWNQDSIGNSTLVWTCLNMFAHFSVLLLVGIRQLESLAGKQKPSKPTVLPAVSTFNPTDWSKLLLNVAKKYGFYQGKTISDAVNALKGANNAEQKWLGNTPDENKLCAFLAYKKLINPKGNFSKEINELENLT